MLLAKEAAAILGPDSTLRAHEQVVSDGHHILTVRDGLHEALDAAHAHLLIGGDSIAVVQSLHEGVARCLHLGNVVCLLNLVLFGLGNLLGLEGLLFGEAIASPDGKREVKLTLGQSCIAAVDILGEIETANNDAGGSKFAPYLWGQFQ